MEEPPFVDDREDPQADDERRRILSDASASVLILRDRLQAIQDELFELDKVFERRLDEEERHREVVDAAGNVTASGPDVLVKEFAHALGPIIRVMAEQFDPDYGTM